MEACIKAYEAGLMIRVSGDVIAMSPPLIVEKAHVDEMIGILGDVIRSLE